MLSIVICGKITNGLPIEDQTESNEALRKTYYESRNWGEAVNIFSVSYSANERNQFQARSKLAEPQTMARTEGTDKTVRSTMVLTTVKPTPNYAPMPQLFTSNGWGPMG